MINHIEKTDFPLFISFRRLIKRKKKPFQQNSKVCVDSGGFSELTLNSKWTIKPGEYVKELERLCSLGLEIEWAAQQDWMCEPFMLKKTGLTVKEHQKLTVENFIELKSFETEIHFIPVLQGQRIEDYLHHLKMFEEAGFDLKNEKIVGVGSVCRRQHTDEIGQIMEALSKRGLNLHGFGVKKAGLKKYGHLLKSADSMAWSFQARYEKKSTSCQSKSKNCANCLHYALEWRQNLLNEIQSEESNS
jgi:hypothetical protein